MPTLPDLLASYPVLESLTGQLTKAELQHLAFSCKRAHQTVTSPAALFKTLKSRVLCDGTGVDERKQLDKSTVDTRCCNGNALTNPENLHCQQETRKPCFKCGFAVCEVRAARTPTTKSSQR